MKLSSIFAFLAVAVSSVAAFADVLRASSLCAQTVELEDGVYHLDAPMVIGQERSGTPEKPLVVRAKNRGKVVISGTVRISDWQKTDLCGGNVWVGTIPGTGDIPGWSAAGCLHKIDLAKLESPISVFAKGDRLTCARWPKAGTWAKVKEVLSSGGRPGGVLQVGTNADVAAWAQEKDLWAHGLWKWEWADAKCRVLEVDVANRSIRVDDTMVKFGFVADRDFYVFNALSAIGGPGEWVVDRKSRKLYVWPKGDIRDVEVTALDHIVTAKGLSNARFEGIVFEGTRRETFLFEDVTNVVVDACCFRHTSKEAIRATGARRLKVTGSDFYDLGEGGVWIEGGDIATLERGDNVVDNSHIHHFGKVVANYKPGVCMKGSGNAITHNLIHHTDHQAIMFNCTDLYIGWNVIHDTLQHNDDAGVIYSCGQDGRGWTDMRGTLIEHNFIHNSGRMPRSHFCFALYYDDQSSGIHTRWNFINRANLGVYCAGGNLHVVESNLVVSCGSALSQGYRGIKTYPSLRRQLEERSRNSAWVARFPETKRILAVEDGSLAHCPLFNRFVGNVEVGCGEDAPGPDVEKRGNFWADNLKLKDETGCRDFLGRDWTLESGSRAFAALGGDLGFAQAGLYDSERRFSPAVKFGESVGVVQPPRPNYNAPVAGSVAVQFRPLGWSKVPSDKRECFAEELVNCEPIPQFKNILRHLSSRARSEWTEYSFSFVPKFDLTADIHLLNRRDGRPTAYDDFRIVGATVDDDIEAGRGWRSIYEKQGDLVQEPPRASGLIEDSAWGFKAAKGHRFVLVDGERHYVHRVELKKGVRVTVTFKARSAETVQD